MNFIGHQQNKSLEVTEIVFVLEFADGIFWQRQATAGNMSVFAD